MVERNVKSGDNPAINCFLGVCSNQVRTAMNCFLGVWWLYTSCPARLPHKWGWVCDDFLCTNENCYQVTSSTSSNQEGKRMVIIIRIVKSMLIFCSKLPSSIFLYLLYTPTSLSIIMSTIQSSLNFIADRVLLLKFEYPNNQNSESVAMA